VIGGERGAAATTTSRVGGLDGRYHEIPNTSTTGHPQPHDYTHHGVGDATTGEAPVDNRTTGAKVKESASGVKGLAAAVHGAGEALRGTFNKEVDRAFGDKVGEARNAQVANAGADEIQEGRFSHATKNREGVVPGADGERRRNQAF